MSRRNVEWLYGQLPDLVENQIVPEDVAEKIRTYYEPQSQQKPRSVALIICGVLGSLLIGLGIILLLAHNWNQLSRPVRTVICFAPLLLGQALAAWTLLKQRGSIAWQESSSTFLMAAIGASIALIGQTYNIPGDMESFILVWMLLTIPIVYLLGASVPAVFYLIGSVCWAGYARWGAGHAMFYWLLLVPVLPHIYLAYRRSPGGFRSLSLFWVFTITLIIGTGMALEYYGSQQWILAYLSLFSSLYLLSDRVFSRSLFALKNPLFLGGTIGVAVVSLILTYRFPWSHLFATYSYFEESKPLWINAYAYSVVGVLFVVSQFLLARIIVTRKLEKVPFALAGFVGALGIVLMWASNRDILPMLLFNAYLLVLGIGAMRIGITEKSLGKANVGLLIMAILIIARFFDSHLSFTYRGMAFILIGVGFLVTNLIIKRRMATQ